MKASYFVLLAVVVIVLISAQFIIQMTEITNLRAQHDTDAKMAVIERDSLRALLAPGLGEYMMGVQQHHAKLWFAGVNKNWDLAAYEIGEIDELFGDVAATHPTNGSIALTPIVQAIRTRELAQLDTVVLRRGESGDFRASFIALNAACNNCHKATEHPFIKIQPPTTPPATNQDYMLVEH